MTSILLSFPRGAWIALTVLLGVGPARPGSLPGWSMNAAGGWSGEFFRAQGVDGPVAAIRAVGPDLYVGGAFSNAGIVAVNNIARWDGAGWDSLGGGVNGPVFAMEIVGDDLYVAGRFTEAGGIPVGHIARWDGVSWSDVGGGTDTSIFTLATYAGRLYAGGMFELAGGNPADHVAMWDGVAWTEVGGGTDGPVGDMEVLGSDLYLCGSFFHAGGIPTRRVAAWNGSSWSEPGQGVEFGVGVLASDGTTLYAGGERGMVWSWDGSSWTLLPGGGNIDAVVLDMATIGQDLYVGGFFGMTGASGYNIARWDGNSWNGLDNDLDLDQVVWTLHADDGMLYAGGVFQNIGGVGDADFLARWDGTAWEAILGEPGNGLNGTVYAMTGIGGILYAGGQFTVAGSDSARNIARWDGKSWSPLGEGVDGTVYALRMIGKDLYAGGSFSMAGGLPVSNLARWDGTSWFDVGGGANDVVTALTSVGDSLFAGGFFNSVGGWIPAGKVALWDGSAWSALGSGVNAVVWALEVMGSDVYAGGEFTTAGGSPASRVARWSGSAWFPLGPGVDGAVRALAIFDSALIAGGKFTAAGTDSAHGIAAWDGADWSPLGTGIRGGTGIVGGQGVWCLEPLGADLYAGGLFTEAGGDSASNVARWDGTSWSGLGSGTNHLVRSVRGLYSSLYAGGMFTRAGGLHSARIGRWSDAGAVTGTLLELDEGWSLVSLPLSTGDDDVIAWFPYSSVVPWSYEGAYVQPESLEPGRGYWVKYPLPTPVYAEGLDHLADTIPLSPGWNLIGALARPVAVTSLGSTSGGLTVSNFFGYDHGYATTDTLHPGRGYWVRSETAGDLVLDTLASAAARALRIIPGTELPPPAPGESGVDPAPGVPVGFRVDQNYPNPFNPVTTIRYAVPAPGTVRLTVYTVLGQRVYERAIHHDHPGVHSVRFDGTGLPGGVYYCRLDAGGHERTMKMMLLR